MSWRLDDVDGTNVNNWEQIKDFHCNAMVKFYDALKQPLMDAAKKAKQ